MCFSFFHFANRWHCCDKWGKYTAVLFPPLLLPQLDHNPPMLEGKAEKAIKRNVMVLVV